VVSLERLCATLLVLVCIDVPLIMRTRLSSSSRLPSHYRQIITLPPSPTDNHPTTTLSTAAPTPPTQPTPNHSVFFLPVQQLKANAFNILSSDLIPIAVGLYPSAAMLNHRCDPNVAVVFEGKRLCVRSLCAIEAGSELSTSYVELAATSSERCAELCEAFAFRCECALCAAPLSDEKALLVQQHRATDQRLQVGGWVDMFMVDACVCVGVCVYVCVRVYVGACWFVGVSFFLCASFPCLVSLCVAAYLSHSRTNALECRHLCVELLEHTRIPASSQVCH
jgi:SET domain